MGEKDDGRFKWRIVTLPRQVIRLGWGVLMVLVLFAADITVRLYHVDGKGILALISDSFSSAGDRLSGVVRGDRYAEVTLISGSVSIKRAGALEWESARTGLHLHPGDIIRTFSGSHTRLAFDDGSALEIKPDSLVIIGDLEEDSKKYRSTLRLMNSDVIATTPDRGDQSSEFMLRTPGAQTRFQAAKVAVKVGPSEESQIRVYSGNALVEAGQNVVSLGERQAVTVSSSAMASVVSELPGIPHLTAPSPGDTIPFREVGKQPVVFQWRAAPAPHEVVLEVAEDADFTRIVATANGRGGSLEMKGPGEGTYYARAKGVNAHGAEGEAGEPVRFMMVRDVTPPDVSIDSVMVSTGPKGADIYLSGQTEAGASVMFNGVRLLLDGRGRFTWHLTEYGSEKLKIRLEAADRLGNRKVEDREIPVR